MYLPFFTLRYDKINVPSDRSGEFRSLGIKWQPLFGYCDMGIPMKSDVYSEPKTERKVEAKRK